MANPATTLARTTQDERIPGLPVLPIGTDVLTLTVPAYNPATDKTHQAPLGGPAPTSNNVVGGPKLVQYLDSRFYGVPAGALTLDRLLPASIVPGTVATVDNPASMPLTVTEPPKEYVATLVATGTAGAVLVSRYIGAAPGDTVPMLWQEIVAGPTLDPYQVSLAIRQAVADGFAAQDAANNDSPFLADPQPTGSVVGMEFDDPDNRYNYRFGPVAFSNGTFNVWRSFLLARVPHYQNIDEVPVAKAQAVVDANVPALDEPDLSYDGKSFYDDRKPDAIVKFECRKSRGLAGPNGYSQSLKWFRSPSMPAVDLLALSGPQIVEAQGLTYDLDGDALPADSPAWSKPGMSFDAVDTNGESWHYYVGRYRFEAGNPLSGVGPAWKRFLKLQQ